MRRGRGSTPRHVSGWVASSVVKGHRPRSNGAARRQPTICTGRHDECELGNLLCAVAGLLDGATGLNGILANLTKLLNQLLAVLG